MKNFSKYQEMMTIQQEIYYHQKYYKIIVIDLSRQTNTSSPQQINFAGKLEGGGPAMLVIAEKQQKTILNFSLDSLIVIEQNK